jgi:preprotein translocase subunit SecA
MSIITSITHTRRIFSPRAKRARTKDLRFVEKLRAASDRLSSSSDGTLAEQMADLRTHLHSGFSVTDETVLVPAFALVVEAARRTLGITLYDVQLLGGLALAGRSIAEMQTGEGKTFVAMLPASLYALSGEGVHVMTVNSYLASRDFELLAPVYRMLGLSVGLVDSKIDVNAKQAAYACDITYGPGYEFGFDYLRDQVAIITHRRPRLGEAYRIRQRGGTIVGPQLMQRGHAIAIVDEADSVFLDEATTPLLLSAGGDRPAANAQVYQAAAHAAEKLDGEEHYFVDHAASTLRLTQAGMELCKSESASIPSSGLDRAWPGYVEQALRAEQLFHRDVHYIVDADSIQLVDQNTGRIFEDRTWRDGLQQAVQAKEGVTITTETNSIARITRQRYFGLYKQLCGMTGTASGSQRELRSVYGLNVVVIPPNKPCRRQIQRMRLFVDRTSKEEAIIEEIARIHLTGQPILVGTESIELSERLARLLDDRKITFQLLNGKQDAEEAEIIAQAGHLGSVTIATNMAGRGTDIKLRSGVSELGGLHVIAASSQESTRVDRQLVGRAARQGDPGSCQTFASAEDELFKRHTPTLAHRIARQADKSGKEQGDLITEIASLQRRIERQKAKLRQQMFAHDDWLEGVLEKLAGSH